MMSAASGTFVRTLAMLGIAVLAVAGCSADNEVDQATAAAHGAPRKDANCAKLERAVREITGGDVDTFQGKYSAGSFSANSGGSRSDPTQSPGISKWVDEDGVVHYGDQLTGYAQ